VTGSHEAGPAAPPGQPRVSTWLRWLVRDAGRRLRRWSSLILIAVLAVPELTWAWDPLFTDDSPVQGGIGLIARGEGLWTVVVIAAAVPASIVVTDRRDGLVLLLRLRGLRPLGYLAVRAGVAGLVAATLAAGGLLVSLVGLVTLVGPEAAWGPGAHGPSAGAAPLASDIYSIAVASMMAGGLAGVAAVAGSVVRVPIVPNLVPLASFVAAAWMESILPPPVSGIAGAASSQPGLSLGAPAIDVVLPLLVWPATAVVLILLVGPRQESLWHQ
jgi:hypothetical protein